jgi:iron complex outermembrane receptor protein
MKPQKISRARVLRRSLMTLACAAAATPAWSQNAPTPPATAASAAGDQGAQRVEITGSRLKQIDAEGVSPVQVIRREDITHTGATTVREMLASLSAASTSGTLSDLNGSNSFSPGASGASLRNLGKQSTLVLLNGRRLAAFPLADYSEVFTNVDSLPLAAIERIEILKNGGSALYGSDAVAGVINIITRTSYTGLQVDYSNEKSLKNGQFGQRSGGITAGIGDYASDGWNVFGNLELFNRDELLWNRVTKDVNPAYGEHSASFNTTSTFAYPGNLIGVGPLPGCTNVVGGLCRYDRYSRFEAIPATKRANLFLSGRKRLGDDLEWFSELTYSDIRVNYQSAYQTYGGDSTPPLNWGNPITGESKHFYYRDLPATHPLNPTGDNVEFRYRFLDGPSYQQTNTTQYRLLTGLKGTTNTYDWESAVGVMGGTTHNIQRGSFSDTGFKQVIGDYGQPDPITGAMPTVPDDFFNVPGGYKIGQPNSAAVLNTLFPTFGYEARNQQYFWDGNVRGDLFKLPAGTVQLDTGFELRHEQMTITPSANLASGDIVGYGTSQSDAKRNFGAIFAELGVPIVKNLDGTLAGRLDKFPGFGAHFSPKAGLKFKPIEQALFRATYETGFRAPNLTESAASTKFAFAPNVDDPKRCDQALAYATDLSNQGDALSPSDPQQAILYSRAQQVFNNECGTSVAEKTTNNPALKPETSKSFTFGTVLQTFSRWSASIDYWNIHRRNEINTKSPQDLLAAESSQAPGVINRQTSFANDPTFSHDPNGLTDAALRQQYGVVPGDYFLESIHTQFENLFQTKTDGIDVSVKGSVPTPVGEFGVDIDASFTHSYKVFSPTLNGFGDNLAGRYGYPKWVVNSTVSYTVGHFDQSLRYVYNSRTALKLDFDDTQWDQAGCADAGLSAAECHIHTYNRVDYSVTYTGFKNMTLGLFVGNIFQRRPPPDFREFGAPSGVIPVSTEDAAGRTGKIIFSYKFL